jgi:tryptophanase
MTVIIEPFRIKSVEPIHFTTREEREILLKKAHYNLFLIKAHDVIIDLLTDSGTSAMSSKQWAGIMEGDESYAGSDSFYRFEAAVQNITKMKYVIPTHQGRAAEKILFTILGGRGKYFISNTLFDTTRANIEYSGAVGVDLLCEEGKHPSQVSPFKGNIDLKALENFILLQGAENIPMVIITVTNNSGGGQPVSMENIREAKKICIKYNIPFYLDACRFAENAYFIKMREKGYENKPMLDAFANIGGFLALNNEKLAQESRNLLIITEGFPTYGGLAGRDLDAIAIGLEEVLHEDYLHYRIRSIQYLGEKMDKENIPYLKPTGGHAIYLDAKAFLPHIPEHEFPGQSLCCALYLEGGIRSVEIGTLMFGKYDKDGGVLSPPMELVRLAFPRRVYTQSHIDYVGECIIETYKKRNALKGYKIIKESPLLRHFTAELEMLTK